MEIIAKSMVPEGWQSRASGQPNTRYAVGAMQEVGPEYTRICIETANRVGDQLDRGLTEDGTPVEFRLQGSVPLNVHIRGVSDVDLLVLATDFHTYDTTGQWARSGVYRYPTNRTSVDVLKNIRGVSEGVLRAKYPAATVDTSGSKAIAIYGGSLARPVDVVPAHWHDNATYQSSAQEYDRTVYILDKRVPTTISNLPFLHIKRVSDACGQCGGSLRKAIRLAKSLKADAIEDGINIKLPSFDIAALMYHADRSALRMGSIYELGILAEAQRFLDALATNKTAAESLMTPDGTRKIINSEEKWRGLISLSIEFDDLVREVAKEQSKSAVLPSDLPGNRRIIETASVA